MPRGATGEQVLPRDPELLELVVELPAIGGPQPDLAQDRVLALDHVERRAEVGVGLDDGRRGWIDAGCAASVPARCRSPRRDASSPAIASSAMSRRRGDGRTERMVSEDSRGPRDERTASPEVPERGRRPRTGPRLRYAAMFLRPDRPGPARRPRDRSPSSASLLGGLASVGGVVGVLLALGRAAGGRVPSGPRSGCPATPVRRPGRSRARRGWRWSWCCSGSGALGWLLAGWADRGPADRRADRRPLPDDGAPGALAAGAALIVAATRAPAEAGPDEAPGGIPGASVCVRRMGARPAHRGRIRVGQPAAFRSATDWAMAALRCAPSAAPGVRSWLHRSIAIRA